MDIIRTFHSSPSVVCYKVATHRKFGGKIRHFLFIHKHDDVTHDAGFTKRRYFSCSNLFNIFLTCLARRRIFLLEHFCQSLFITFVEEWYLKKL